MASRWAIAIGIHQYARMVPLPYAKVDATAVRNFLLREAKFDQVYYFAAGAPAAIVDGGVMLATEPTLANLQRFLEVRFALPFLNPEDILWFFFSGHGLHFGNRDYLLPSDAEPEVAETTAIAIDDLVHYLKRSGTANIVLFLDACHTEEQKFGQGFGTDPEGVTTIFATAFNQTSQAIAALNQGAFTYALLGGFHLSRYYGGSLRHLYNYLYERLPQLTLRYGDRPQFPRLHTDPARPPEAIQMPFPRKRKPAFSPRNLLVGAIALGSAVAIGYLAYQNIIRPSNLLPTNSLTPTGNSGDSTSYQTTEE
jgi:uncharacterized caspase-like protein